MKLGIFLAALGGASMLALAAPAAAQTPVPFFVGNWVNSELAHPAEKDIYTLKMTSGQVVAFLLSPSQDAVKLELLNPGGSLVKSVTKTYYREGGFDYRAPTPGTYKLRLSPVNDGGGEYYPRYYSIWAKADCLGTIKSTCSQPINEWRDRDITFPGDRDALRVYLTKGRTYVFQVDTSYLDIQILDKNNVSKGTTSQQVLTIVPAYTGYHWMVTWEREGIYRIGYRTTYFRR
jgi:hypothetical protein